MRVVVNLVFPKPNDRKHESHESSIRDSSCDSRLSVKFWENFCAFQKSIFSERRAFSIPAISFMELIMNILRIIKWSILTAILLSLVACKDNKQSETATQESLPAGAVPNALPFTLVFEQANYGAATPLPRLQSYVFATSAQGYWLIVGGRRQGLHTFEPAPANNFIPDSSNNYL